MRVSYNMGEMIKIKNILGMNSLENIGKLSNDELFRELKKRGVNVGPVSPTTRKIYEKKLESLILTKMGSKKSPLSVASEALSHENVLNYTDEELFKALKERGVDPGPITPTTRQLYQKKLMSLIKHSKIPGYPNLDRSISASTSPNKSTEISKSIQTDYDSEIPNFVEDPKLFPSLEFKLLRNGAKNFHQPVEKDENEENFLKINNFEISNKFGNPLTKFSHPNEKSNGSYLDYFQPKSQVTKKNLLRNPTRKLNLDTELFENKQRYFEKEGNKSFAMSSYDNLYNQPPPPQPMQSNNPVRLVNASAEQKFNMGHLQHSRLNAYLKYSNNILAFSEIVFFLREYF
ncbi:lamina-associated polypeptide isoforms beta gamma isoform X1 [Brachionus plicatilis]|uniref:Lamina-associated polypeptide isoforms beta gamma isoform X1 n=1 Tax=Brachionus plicatilis TaxID=10195 RepID=A0A3M7RCC8_BRAPC|nr:lamina-associated polypeptide isoforms beta gamma isoform X1 [Brachionus plicatilis]